MTFYKPENDEIRELISTTWYSIDIEVYSTEIHEWLHSSKNMKNDWYIIQSVKKSQILFKDQDEYVLFKMVWI